MGAPIARLARRLRAQTGPRYRVGVTIAEPAAGAVKVEVGSRVVTAVVPEHIRGLAEGQGVRISEQDNVRMVSAVLAAAATPAVADAPAAVAAALGFTAAGFAQTGFTSADYQLMYYSEYLSDRIEEHRAALDAFTTTLQALVDALRDQGHIT